MNSKTTSDFSNHSISPIFCLPSSWIKLLAIGIYLSLAIGCSDKTELGIEGKVLAESGQPLVGAQVSISGPESHSSATDSNGYILGVVT